MQLEPILSELLNLTDKWGINSLLFKEEQVAEARISDTQPVPHVGA